jgi:hypothetical protein
VIRSLRHLLALLLVLALPLQGYAAGTMLLCGPLHQGTMTAQSAPSAAHRVAAPSHDAGHDHSQHQAMTKAQDSSRDPVDAGTTPVNKVYGKCSLCAACCAVVALPSAAPLFDSEPAATQYVVAATVTPAGFLTGGIERPPRPVLA